jgi:DNA repair protein SbcD/Mre11
MRFIHTGDWHLGKALREWRLIEDQRYALGQLVRLAEELRPDAVVVAGDVYDRAIPPVEAVELLDWVLTELALRLGIPVIMIAGNHDSPVRLQCLGGLLTRVRLHVVGEVGASPRGVAVTGADGVEVVFWPLAYTSPEAARQSLGRADIATHEAALAAQLEVVRARMDPGARHVVVAHAFVTGATTSESERPLTVGGSGEVSRALFDGFDYVALGHLHRPQAVGDRGRYAGSLLKYSFDEASHVKSVSVVEMSSDGAVEAEQVRLDALHDLARIRGTFEEVRTRPDAGDFAGHYVEVVLTDDEVVFDPVDKLRSVYPNILWLRREGAFPELADAQPTSPEEDDVRGLFAAFFADVTGEQLGEAQQREVDAALAEQAAAAREVAG